MTKEAEEILHNLEKYLHKNPEMRFGQALFNLNINQFADEKIPESKNFLLRDIYNDEDEKVLRRMLYVK